MIEPLSCSDPLMQEQIYTDFSLEIPTKLSKKDDIISCVIREKNCINIYFQIHSQCSHAEKVIYTGKKSSLEKFRVWDGWLSANLLCILCVHSLPESNTIEYINIYISTK